MLRFIPSTIRQTELEKNNTKELRNIYVFVDEEFAFQVELYIEESIWVNLNKADILPWKGLERRCRLEVEDNEVFKSKISFEDSVLDDNNILKKDKISNKNASYLSRGYHNFWIDAKALKSGKYKLKFNILESSEYEEEKIIASKELNIEVMDFRLNRANKFHLNLWQHLSSIARKYDVDLYGDEHFRIIKNFITPLAKAGQKVCNLIVSDYSWAGQNCHTISKNCSSLYEYNMIKIYIENCQLKLDFSAIDRYIAMCNKLNMAEEIVIFGMLGNWSDNKFPKIINGYDDSIRLRAYDKDKNRYVFIDDINMLKEYFRLIFIHLKEKDYIDKVKIVADQPKKAKQILKNERFIRSCGYNGEFGYTINNVEFLKNYTYDRKNISIFFDEFLKDKNIKSATWYVCWKSNVINQFIKSKLIESRLVGYITYLFGFDGFLRWSYCLWPDSDDIRYNGKKWPAGDMFFVYPSINSMPELSIRFRELSFGIYDYNFLLYCEKILKRESIIEIIEESIGNIEKYLDNGIEKQANVVFVDDFYLIKKKLFDKISGMRK